VDGVAAWATCDCLRRWRSAFQHRPPAYCATLNGSGRGERHWRLSMADSRHPYLYLRPHHLSLITLPLALERAVGTWEAERGGGIIRIYSDGVVADAGWGGRT